LISFLGTAFATSATAKLLKGNPKFWGAPVAQSHPTLYSRYDFMMGLSNPHQHGKCEFAASAIAKMLKRNPKKFRELPYPGPPSFFFWMRLYDGPWQTPTTW